MIETYCLGRVHVPDTYDVPGTDDGMQIQMIQILIQMMMLVLAKTRVLPKTHRGASEDIYWWARNHRESCEPIVSGVNTPLSRVKTAERCQDGTQLCEESIEWCQDTKQWRQSIQ